MIIKNGLKIRTTVVLHVHCRVLMKTTAFEFQQKKKFYLRNITKTPSAKFLLFKEKIQCGGINFYKIT